MTEEHIIIKKLTFWEKAWYILLCILILCYIVFLLAERISRQCVHEVNYELHAKDQNGDYLIFTPEERQSNE
jgi:hypothetical protein